MFSIVIALPLKPASFCNKGLALIDVEKLDRIHIRN